MGASSYFLGALESNASKNAMLVLGDFMGASSYFLDALGNFRVRWGPMHLEIAVPYFLNLWTRRGYF